MASNDVPKSVRIRTGEGNEYRFDAIEKAAELYDRNKSDAVACACDDIARLTSALEDVLQRDDLTRQQQREIAQRLDRSLSLDIVVENEVTFE
jgi:RecA/RadA recombinase